MTTIYKYIVKLFFYLIYGKISLKKLANIKINKFKIDNKRSYKLYEIDNGRVFTDCVTNVAYIKKNILIPNISFQQVKNSISHIKFNSTLKKGTPKFIKKFQGNVLSLVQGASGNNYFHWLFDVIPKLAILEKNNLLGKMDYYYLPKISNYALYTLSQFNIKKNQIISSQKFKHIQSDKIYAMEHIYLGFGNFQNQFKKIPKWVIKFLRYKFLKKKNSRTKIKIYIDRSDSLFSHFQINNQKQIIGLLKKKGFKIYKMSLIDFNKQVSLFNNAKVVMGVHGAGFANIVFCRPRTKVFEILTHSEKNRSLVKTICKHANLLHKKIILSKKTNTSYKLQLGKGDLELIESLV